MRGSRARQVGFTIIELLIVLALIALLAATLLPRLGGGFALGIRNASRVLAADLRYTSQRAIATGRLHVWTLDLDAQTFRLEERREVEREDDGTPTHASLLDLSPPLPEWEYVPVSNRTGEWRWLDEDGVAIDRVYIGDEEIDTGVVSIAFSGTGGADPAEIRLVDDHGYVIDLVVLAFTGEIRVYEEPDAQL